MPRQEQEKMSHRILEMIENKKSPAAHFPVLQSTCACAARAGKHSLGLQARSSQPLDRPLSG